MPHVLFMSAVQRSAERARAERFGYDVAALFLHVRERAKHGEWKIVKRRLGPVEKIEEIS
jgi:hypothetical protein